MISVQKDIIPPDGLSAPYHTTTSGFNENISRTEKDCEKSRLSFSFHLTECRISGILTDRRIVWTKLFFTVPVFVHLLKHS